MLAEMSPWKKPSHVEIDSHPASRLLIFSAPYDQVHIAVRAALAGLRGVTVTHQDPASGVIRAEKRSLLPGRWDEVHLRVAVNGYRIEVEVEATGHYPFSPSRPQESMAEKVQRAIEEEVLLLSRSEAWKEGRR